MRLGLASCRLYRPNSPHLSFQITRRAFRATLQKKGQDVSTEVSRTRNIGIIAHIDAVGDKLGIASGCNTYEIQG